ncbi:MAG: hypothetical protein F6J93_09880 [Oscillatoria sp. SIO1A7]|nr:hypothetical protein [Oscillatoria sp. SIO1A7]
MGHGAWGMGHWEHWETGGPGDWESGKVKSQKRTVTLLRDCAMPSLGRLRSPRTLCPPWAGYAPRERRTEGVFLQCMTFDF